MRARVASKEPGNDRIRAVIAFLVIFIFLNVLFAWLTGLLYNLGYLGSDAYNAELDALLSMSFSISVFYYLFLYRRETPGRIVSGLGLGRSVITPKRLAVGLLLFAIVAVMEAMMTAFSGATGVRISSGAATALASLPFWFYIFSAIIAPINEEILFRGFLVPRIGIVASSVLFAIGHIGYNSTFGVEVIGAFAFGLLSGYVYKRTGSLYPSIIAHILVNASTLILTFVIL